MVDPMIRRDRKLEDIQESIVGVNERIESHLILRLGNIVETLSEIWIIPLKFSRGGWRELNVDCLMLSPLAQGFQSVILQGLVARVPLR